MEASIEPVPEDWDRALAVVAHPDDLEYGASAAIARWTGQGKWVGYCLVTSGEAGIDSLQPDQAAPLRREEQVRSAEAVGVDVVEFLGHPDGLIVADVTLRRDLAAVIRRHRPDVLVTINFRERWPAGLNHADHRAVGWAMLDATRDAANRWVFPGVGGDPWAGVRFALISGSPETTHYVDTSATIDAGVASLREHASYLDALAEGTVGKDPDTFLRMMAAEAGRPLGLEAAATFELIPLG